MRDPTGQFPVNVAALDDVVALSLLSVALTIIGGRFAVISGTGSVLESIVARVVLLLAAVLILPRLLRVRHVREAQAMPLLFLLVLVVAVVSLGSSAVIGAFIAGRTIAESRVASRTREITDVRLILFGSLFFVVTGAQFNVSLFADVTVIGFAVPLAALAAVGKFAGVYPFARRRLGGGRSSMIVSAGTIPGEEFGLIVGSIGFTTGLLTSEVLGEILRLSIVTTLVGAAWFRHRLAAERATSDPPGGTGTRGAAPDARPLR